MKYLQLLLIIFVLLLNVSTVSASQDGDKHRSSRKSKQVKIGTVDIRGIVYSNGTPVPHASVTATCNGKSLTVLTSSSPAIDIGWYSITFSQLDCPKGSSVDVSGTSNGESGANQTTVSNAGIGYADIFLGVVAVPEFGTITGGLALITSLGTLWKLRQKKDSAQGI